MASERIAQSPKAATVTPTTMDFPAAIAAVRDGQAITKLEWQDSESYGILRDGRLMIHLKKPENPEYTWHLWIINDGDLMGSDWIIRPTP